MYDIDLAGKTGVVFGVANHRSIAWHISQVLAAAGARLVVTYQNERFREGVAKLVEDLPTPAILLECDVSGDGNIEKVYKSVADTVGAISFVVHSIAFANREDLAGDFSHTPRAGFNTALEISAYSFIPVVRYAVPLMTDGGSVLTMTFIASQRTFAGYNVMGTAKAALEHEVRQLAYELGPKRIRVNAISAGPLDTLAARGIHGFLDMKKIFEERAPMRRNITHEEVAKTALYLLSDLSSGVTGAIVPVDAGYHITGM